MALRWKDLLLLLCLFTVMLFIISTFFGIVSHEQHTEISLETFNQLANKDEFYHHVEDMQRLRKSIIFELAQLEQKRSQLKDSMDSLNKKHKDTDAELKNMERKLIQVKSDIQSMLLMRDETLKDYSPVVSPLKLRPNADEPINQSPKVKCNLSACFDYSRCSVVSGFPIYLYPLTTTNNILLEWKSAIVKSHYITSNPDLACIYVLLYDGTNADPEHLKYWRGDGRNHAIINVMSSNFVPPKSRAMLLQFEFYKDEPNYGFDITLPSTNMQSLDHTDLPLLLPVRRLNLLSFYGKAPTATDENEKGFIAAFANLHTPKLSVNIDLDCLTDPSCSPHHWCACKKNSLGFTERNATFVVVPNFRNMPLGQFSNRVYISLLNGAIPIILGDHHHLPMDELIPWSKAVISIPSQRVTELIYIVRNLLEPDIMAYKKQGRSVVENYLMSVPKVVNGLFDLLRARINIPPTAAPVPDSNLIYNQDNPMVTFETRLELSEVLGPLEEPYPSPAYQRNFTTWHGGKTDLPWSMTTNIFPHTPWDPILPTDAKFHGMYVHFRKTCNIKWYSIIGSS